MYQGPNGKVLWEPLRGHEGSFPSRVNGPHHELGYRVQLIDGRGSLKQQQMAPFLMTRQDLERDGGGQRAQEVEGTA